MTTKKSLEQKTQHTGRGLTKPSKKSKSLSKSLTPTRSHKTSQAVRDEIFTLLMSFFNDEAVVLSWIAAPNPLLGNISPSDMILAGREAKLLKFIKNSIEENNR